MLVTYISDMMFGDLVLLLPIAFVLIAVVLYISFRSVIGVVLPMLNAVVAVIWTLGIIALCGYEMSMISNNIPIILLAVGSAYTIHVVNRINRYKRKDSKRTIVLVMMFIFIPVTLAALTTMIGFLSFIYGSYLEMIRFFGIFTALGTFLAAVFSLFVVPAVISTITIKNSKFAGNVEEQKFSIMTRHFLVPLKNLLHRHPKYTLTVWGILIVVSLGGIFMIKRSVDIRDYFKKDNPTRTAEDIMTKKFGGSKPVFVHFKGDMQSPEVLKTMLNAEAYMKQSPDIVTTQSVAGLIAEINGVMGEGYGIPETRDKIEQMWFLLEGNEIMPRFVSEGLDEGIIVSKFVSPDNKAKKEFARFINKFIVENSTEECQISITGMPFVDITMDESLVKSQFGSLTLAIIFVVIVVGAIFRSIKTGFYAMLPIIASIIILFGFMGYAGISLNIATVLVASVAMGIGIDYSIHVISHFNHAFTRKNNLSFALDETIMVSGKAIVINVVSVTAGFLVLLFSEMVPLQYFGLLIAMSMIGSSLGALTLLPVILILVNKKHAHKKI
jgi:predicted RND superfamily exporter protein